MSTVEVVQVAGGSARLGIYSRDHCPPHATCRDVAQRWVVRITFSFLDAQVGVLSVVPPQNSPGVGVINDLADAVLRNLPECRRLWWDYRRTNPAAQADGPCCLNNQLRSGTIISDATYDPATCRTNMRLADGTTVGVTV